MTATYDSRHDTEAHIGRVRSLIHSVITTLYMRAISHDASKLEEPEKSGFDQYTPILRSLEYGSEEYENARNALSTTLNHHYQNNRHHPEYFPDGVNNMTLIDLVEMLCDWKAATERHATGDIRKSLVINASRFKISDQLFQILANTVEEMGW